MNKKGFTLIELLSVVIILSIIIFLVLPNVTNLLKSNEDKTNEITLSLIENAAKLHIEDNNTFYKKIDDSKYCIRINKLVKNDYLEGRIKYNNEDITDTKSIQVTYNRGFTYELVDNASCTGDIIGCTVVKGDGTKTGDEIECGGEYFYVIENDGTTISMLSKYNLNVGSNPYTEGTMGIQNENVVGYKLDETTYGNISFSTSDYWSNNDYSPAGDSLFDYVYDSNSILYSYVENYETYLKDKGVSRATATLISYEQLDKLGCKGLSWTCNSSQYSWVYSTSYWSGSSRGVNYIRGICSNGTFGGKCYNGDDYYNRNEDFGIRPVINISVNEI